MPAKLTFICVIHSVSEKDSLDYVIREAIGIIRREDNESLD
ncbi:2996_t:CDS:1, partial [Funneliformis caledonium]